MPLIPSRALVLLALVPLCLAGAMLFDRTLLWPMLAADAVLLLVAGLDALLAVRGLCTVERRVARVLSVGRPNPVTLEVRGDGTPHVVGVAAIVEGSLPWHAPEPRFVEAIARALQEAGDVTSERAAGSV